MKDRSGWVGTGVASVTGQGSGAAEPSRLSRGQGFREPQPSCRRQPARQAHRRHVAAPREPASPSGPAVRRARRPPWSWRQPGASARSVSQLRAARGDGQQRNGSDVVTAGGRSGPSTPRHPPAVRNLADPSPWQEPRARPGPRPSPSPPPAPVPAGWTGGAGAGCPSSRAARWDRQTQDRARPPRRARPALGRCSQKRGGRHPRGVLAHTAAAGGGRGHQTQ